MKRRHWLVGGAGALAAASGLGWQLWREQQREQALHEATGGLWQMRFARPDGSELAMPALRGQPLVLNFWATWCPPCVKEMPEIDRFHRRFAPQGWQVVGLAVDRLQPVKDFLARTPVGYAVGMAGFEGTDLSRRLGNDSGALPFTAVFGRDGRVLQRRLGETSFDELSAWAAGI